MYFSSERGRGYEEFLDGISKELVHYRNNSLGLVAHIYNPSPGKTEAEGDHEFQLSTGYKLVRPCFKKEKIGKTKQNKTLTSHYLGPLPINNQILTSFSKMLAF